MRLRPIDVLKGQPEFGGDKLLSLESSRVVMIWNRCIGASQLWASHNGESVKANSGKRMASKNLSAQGSPVEAAACYRWLLRTAPS